MITHREAGPAPALHPPDEASACVWGLSARELHEAFWFARGVQCVRRGAGEHLQRAAELYLLIEGDQLVLFNIRPLGDRLTWRNAKVTRLRLIDEHAEAYHECVVLDEDGFVQRIERRYTPTLYGSYRVLLTPSRRLAAMWSSSAGERRQAWDRIRRAVPWSRVDHCRIPGRAYRDGEPEQERCFLDELVAQWSTPDQAIDGIAEVAEGVWCAESERLPDDSVRIGPLWLGRGTTGDGRPCLVGPAWVADKPPETADSAGPSAASVRPIIEVEPSTYRERGHRGPRAAVYVLVKRAMDITVSLVALAVFSPLMAIIGTAIVLTEGRPIFYGQVREGRGGRPFRCWKFRTMYRNAEEIARKLERMNLCDGPQIFIEDDPRVTRVGRVLRASHLDELPQLWNVLMGHMSLVGPRPSPADENRFCPAWRDARLSVRPGMTGMWQLLRKREPGEDFQEWIRYDLDYVERAGLRLDLKIMYKTAVMLVTGRERVAPK